MQENKYGIKIRNIQAGSLYDYNLGVRNNYDYKKAMFTNNLLLYFLLENGLKVDKGWTKDIIGINFDYGSRSYEAEKSHLEKLLSNENNKYSTTNIEYFKELLTLAETNKDKFDEKSKEEIRVIFYTKGVNVEYLTYKKDGSIKKREIIHYQMLYRSAGKAKQGSCIFICDRLYKKARDFIYMGYKVPKNNAPIIELGAYSSLIASSIIDTIKINPKNILILKDIESSFVTNIISVETNKEQQCIAVQKSDYTVVNNMYDGQALIDENIFPNWGEGYLLLRHQMCKMACFKTRIQKFFKEYYGDQYQEAIVYDMWGNPHYAKDIEVITTNDAMKWIKFDFSYDYWCSKVFENQCRFGIVKTAHKSKLGEVQKMSYQMINSLNIDIMDKVVEKSKKYIEELKKDNDVFLDYLRENQNFSNDFEVLVALCEQNYDFTRSEYFRNRKKKIIESYVNNFKFGKVIQNADNLVIVGSPYAMLLSAVGEDIKKDYSFNQEQDCIQCFTTRFADGEYLAEFRSPFNSKNNMGYLHNVYNNLFFEYFDFGDQIIAVNMQCTDFQDRNNGSDQDSDSIYCTNQKEIVEYAKYCYSHYNTIVNNIQQDTNHYDYSLENYAKIDNILASAQLAIGSASNLAQICLTYSYNFPQETKYLDYVCILSVLAQVAIDNAKRKYAVNLNEEIARIQKDMGINEIGYPKFWKHIKDKKTKIGAPKFNADKINKNLICPMNYLMEVKFQNTKNKLPTLPMEHFFNKFPLETNRRQSKKVEEFITKYSLEIYTNLDRREKEYTDYGTTDSNSILLRNDFDNLIEDIKKIYISKNYLGLTSWLVDRAFLITPNIKSNKDNINRNTNENKALLLKVLYTINPSNVLKVFSKNK